MGKAVSAVLFHAPDARRHQGIVGRGKGQLVHDNRAKLLAGHVHPLPEAGGGEKHAGRLGYKALQELHARGLALHQAGVGQLVPKECAHDLQVAVGGEQHKSPPPAQFEQLLHLPGHGLGEVGVVGRGHGLGHVQ